MGPPLTISGDTTSGPTWCCQWQSHTQTHTKEALSSRGHVCPLVSEGPYLCQAMNPLQPGAIDISYLVRRNRRLSIAATRTPSHPTDKVQRHEVEGLRQRHIQTLKNGSRMIQSAVPAAPSLWSIETFRRLALGPLHHKIFSRWPGITSFFHDDLKKP